MDMVISILVYCFCRKRLNGVVIHLNHHLVADGASNLEIWIRYLSSAFRYGDIVWQVGKVGPWGVSRSVSLITTSASAFFSSQL